MELLPTERFEQLFDTASNTWTLDVSRPSALTRCLFDTVSNTWTLDVSTERLDARAA